jgi:hypothetical protein
MAIKFCFNDFKNLIFYGVLLFTIWCVDSKPSILLAIKDYWLMGGSCEGLKMREKRGMKAKGGPEGGDLREGGVLKEGGMDET